MTTEQKLAAALEHCLTLAVGPGPQGTKVLPYLEALKADMAWNDEEHRELSRRLACALRDRNAAEVDEVTL